MKIDIQLSTRVLYDPRTGSLIAYHSEQKREMQLRLLLYDDHNPNHCMDASKKHPYDQETLDDH